MMWRALRRCHIYSLRRGRRFMLLKENRWAHELGRQEVSESANEGTLGPREQWVCRDYARDSGRQEDEFYIKIRNH